jgi:hypothetical protein
MSIVRKNNIRRLIKHSFVPNKDFGNIGSDDIFGIAPTTTTALAKSTSRMWGEDVPYHVSPGRTDPFDNIIERQFDENIFALTLFRRLTQVLCLLNHHGLLRRHIL